MLFKRLELAGFKSFAKTVSLEFPSKITAVVGPNGSGKSNVADSIRWVLGEQSLKTLRGKKGEDLIFGGTTQVPRMGKAAVSLTFDNRKKTFPLEFDYVSISRTVYRDGVNDYKLNGSPVRLKDIVELLSKVGLGASQHHIIAQGDSDRILYSSPKERKAMIEEALGLKIFELKKTEAQRKLGHTEANLKNVEYARREIQPHLKYLESQAEKMRNAAELRKTSEALSDEYVKRALQGLRDEEEAIKKEKRPAEEEMLKLEEAVKRSESLMQKGNDAQVFFKKLAELDDERNEIIKKKGELEREIGRFEGEEQKELPQKNDALPKSEVRSILSDLLSDIEEAGKSATMESFRNAVFSVTQKIYGVLERLAGKEKNSKNKADVSGAQKLKGELAELIKKENDILERRKNLELDYQKTASTLQKEGSAFRKYNEDLAQAREKIRELSTREERLAADKKELEIDFGEIAKNIVPGGEVLSSTEKIKMRRQIERARILLEEAGGVDDSVVREFDETKKRDEFLGKEMEDLRSAAKGLEEMLEELSKKIESEFREGVGKINGLFAKFFYEIFGGGKASLKVLEPKVSKKKPAEYPDDFPAGEWEGDDEEEESGLDIVVDIPRKRIRSLAMLSGGERALTSIALLFAVSTVNPPPFLVLDETDAALDEANSQRYANMLRELSKRTQLIVVTHNRETMRAAEVLYGVTMGGDGVSRLLSIQLEEAEEVLNKK